MEADAKPKQKKKLIVFAAIALALLSIIAYRMMPTKRPSRPSSTEPAKVFEGNAVHYRLTVPHGSQWTALRPEETPWPGSDIALHSDDGLIAVTGMPAGPEATLDNLVTDFMAGMSLSDVVQTAIPGKKAVLIDGKAGARGEIEIIVGLFQSGDAFFSVIASVDPKATIETVAELKEMIRGFEPAAGTVKPPAASASASAPASAPASTSTSAPASAVSASP